MPMRQIITLAVALLLSFFSGAGAGEADRAVHQKGRMFSVSEMTVTQGETVDFINDDVVPHNTMSISAGNEFDLGSQAPGSMTPVTFSTVGTVAIICAIHPRMHMTITVTH
jgi:plastocyanin